MKVLVIGQGGREHALVRALKVAPSVTAVHALPGSDGMALDCVCHSESWQDFARVMHVIRKEGIDLVVIGPEVALAAGLSDALRKNQIRVVGPSAEAARLESGKIFSKEFMVRAGAPTARYHIVSTIEQTLAAAEHFAPPYVLKADGLAAGKGVFICQTPEELTAAARALFVDKVLGAAGDRALLEEFSPGYEISYLILTNGESFEPLILAQDHKRLGEGDTGPNTGGMGVVGPVEISAELRDQINKNVIAPVLSEMKKQNLLYRGILYVGLMITPKGPSIIEFNVRFGDPEAQVILPLMSGDWGQVLSELAEGRLSPLTWRNGACACVVLAAEGYPDKPVLGTPIPCEFFPASGRDVGYLLHAGTKKTASGKWVTAGGRVINSVGLGANLHEALLEAYKQAEREDWSGRQMRRDIGAKITT